MSEIDEERSPFDVIKGARMAIKRRMEDEAKHVSENRHGSVFSTPSAETIAQYRKDTKAIFAAVDPWAKATDTKKVKTWQKRKSATLCIAKISIIELLKEQDQLQRLGAAEIGSEYFEQWCHLIHKLDFYSTILITQPREFRLEEVVKKSSKRRLTGLSEDWRIKLLGKMTQSWRQQYLVQAVTGCRPAEISKGVLLQVKDGILNIHVKGAKLSQFSGQKARAMSWNVADATPLVAALIQLIPVGVVGTVIDYSKIKSKNPASAYSTAVRDAARRAFPKRSGTITPYSLRHAAASDLKNSGLSSDEQSKALGHQVSETKSVYGSKVYGKRGGSVAPQTAKASTAVRTKPTSRAAQSMTSKIKSRSSGRSNAPKILSSTDTITPPS